ncbi:MAG: choice-of-anchor D domain-containing protein [Candidatus Magnetomorum sp.]|nr:choice-of-anchor D domain-containing protein [Candidatus Magnetomorum sp.]
MKSKHPVLTIIFLLISSGLFFCHSLFGSIYPDYNNDNKTDVKDVIIALQRVAGLRTDPFAEALITSIQIETDATNENTSYPVTLGHVFKKCAVPSGASIKGKLSDHADIPIQVDVKATYDDGSLRHGILSFLVPAATDKQTLDIQLFAYGTTEPSDPPVLLSDVLASDFDSKVSVSMDQETYQISLKTLLSNASPTAWLTGPIASEWQVSSPLISNDGNTHPHLAARFSIRAYKGLKTIRVSATFENNWTYQEKPHNLLYDADIYVGDRWIYGRDHFKHFHHTRWRKVFFWHQQSEDNAVTFDEPVHVRHDIRYFIATKAIPNFNPDHIHHVSETKIQEMVDKWEGSSTFTDPDGNAYTFANNQSMGIGVVYAGTHSHDMWPLPYWTGRYLLSMDRRAKDITLGTADLAGSFPIHFRDQKTGLPVSINDYPYCSTLWNSNDTFNPDTGQYEVPTKCNENDDCWVPYSVNTASMPAFCYVPYMVTGDPYYLEELHFWANNGVIANSPHYRQFDRGLLVGEVIAQAMSLEILGRTVFITPNAHPMKAYFKKILENNQEHIIEQHVVKPQNPYGGLRHSTLLGSRSNDYYTFTLNSLVEMDFNGFKPVLEWNARYPVARMDTGEQFCWIFAATDLTASETNSGPMYQSLAEVYQKSIDDGGHACGSQALADYLKAQGKISKGVAGEMVGYADCVYCYAANMQPALAAAVDARIDGADDAWNRYMTRSVKPNYISNAYPNFDIVPRIMSIARTDLPKASVNAPYSFKFEVNAGEAPFYWEILTDGLPQGLQLDNTTGILTGTPSQAGVYTFSIQVTDMSETSIQKTLVLSVIDPEDVPFIILSRTSVLFSDQLINEKSYAQYVDITNTGRQPLEIQSILTSGVFSILQNCSNLEKGDSCRISVFFKPTVEQQYSELITIKSTAENGEQTIQVSGRGVSIPPEKELGIWVTSMNFGTQPLTVKTMESSVWLANNSQLPIHIQNIRIEGNGFSLINHCGDTLQPKNSCPVRLAFLPETPGEILANLVIDSDADDSPHSIPLKGVGERSGVESSVADLVLKNLSDTLLINQPITVGHSFIQGDIPPGKTVRIALDDTDIPVQVDHKTTHADGSLKHGMLSFVIPDMPAHSDKNVHLFVSHQSNNQPALKTSDLLATDFDASLIIELSDNTYTVSARKLLANATSINQWISGPICTEWIVNAPLTDSNGNTHPHLMVRFEIRAYEGMNAVRSSISLENNWTYQPDPQNFTYHATIYIGEQLAWDQPEQPHFHHARWRKVFWWHQGSGLDHASKIHVKHNTRYLIATQAIPNFDLQYLDSISEQYLGDMETRWTQAKVYGPYGYCDRAYTLTVSDPMAIGFATYYMPMTGGRGDIGPVTQWTSRYLMSMDARAKKIELGTGDLAGSWSIHFRDKNTDLPVSIEDYPYCSTIWNKSTTYNPDTKVYERPTECEEGRDCQTPYSPDTAHQPSFAYVPYLVTGDYYYLEELHFWANYCMLYDNPSYRHFEKGIVKSKQVRGQGWSLRTIGEAAYVTPDDHPMKAYFMRRVDDNLDYYNDVYTNNEMANKLGWIDPLIGFDDGAITSPWMDDFVTFAVGHLSELGFEKAKPFLSWKSRFPVGRMIDDTYCWLFASIYRMAVAPSREDASAGIYYQSFADIYEPTLTWREINTKDIFQDIKNLECNSLEMTTLLKEHDVLHYGVQGEMMGYSMDIEHGYPIILQTALAYAVDSGIAGAAEAWERIQNRSKKPDFNQGASYKWTILPRHTDTDHDGVFDYLDQCPNTNTGQSVDARGCDLLPEEKKKFLSFDTPTGRLADGFDQWYYASPDYLPIGYLENVGGFYSTPYPDGNIKLVYPYLNNYNSDHMGWLRWGYVDIDTQLSVSGSGCLKYVFTGGKYDNDGTVAAAGLEIRYKEELENYLNQGITPYASIPLSLDISLYIKNHNTSTGTFDEAQGMNRLSLWIFLPKHDYKDMTRPDNTIAWYPFIDTSKEDHYYHYVSNIGMGSWTHVLFDAHPLHNNSGDSNPHDFYRAGGIDCPGNAEDYFSRVASFCFRIKYPSCPFPLPIYFDDIDFYKTPQPENDETIANIGVGYDPEEKRFDISFCDKYRGQSCAAVYEIKYAFEPITHNSYSQAKDGQVIPDPDVGFTYYTDTANQIKKPVNGYSQIWAKFTLAPEDRALLTQGQHIYFAVKDISNRSFDDQDTFEYETVDVPGIGPMRRIDLIKTIDYRICSGKVK